MKWHPFKSGADYPLCAFLEVPWNPVMLDYHRDVKRSMPDEKRHLWPLLDKPPQKDNTERWKTKMTAGERVGFEKRAGRILRELRYETLVELKGAAWAEVNHLLGRASMALSRRLMGRTESD